MRRKLSTMLAAALAMTVIAIPASAVGHNTILGAVEAEDGEFDVLEAAIFAVGVDGLLDSNGAFTVFAPTDKAFAKLAKDLGGTNLKTDTDVVLFLVDELGLDVIAEVLAYHVVDPGVGFAVDSSAVVALPAAPMFDGNTVGIFAPGKASRSIQFVDNDPDARNPKLVKGLFDIEVDNGIIHGIDRVLRPFDIP